MSQAKLPHVDPALVSHLEGKYQENLLKIDSMDKLKFIQGRLEVIKYLSSLVARQERENNVYASRA